MKILIAGDSFSSSALSDSFGWPKLLSDMHEVVNVSRPGIGQYKIMCALESQPLDQFDAVIVSHTSPNRVHCAENLLYPPHHVYRNSDLIFADAEHKRNQSADADLAYNYFVKIFDANYYEFIHRSCCEKIDQMTRDCRVVHMTHFEWDNLYQFDNMLNFYQLWNDHKGTYNHYTADANRRILQTITKLL
jgi:hypothetical protein